MKDYEVTVWHQRLRDNSITLPVLMFEDHRCRDAALELVANGDYYRAAKLAVTAWEHPEAAEKGFVGSQSFKDRWTVCATTVYDNPDLGDQSHRSSMIGDIMQIGADEQAVFLLVLPVGFSQIDLREVGGSLAVV